MTRAKLVILECGAIGCSGPAFETESAVNGDGPDKFFIRNYSIGNSGPMIKDRLIDPYPQALSALQTFLVQEGLKPRVQDRIIKLFKAHYSAQTGLSKKGTDKIQNALAAAGSTASLASFLGIGF